MNEMTASRARGVFPSIQDAAANHEPTRITRRRGMSAVLLSDDDYRAILERAAFAPEVFREAGAVSIWLPELAIWGRGASFVEAKTDLLDEIVQLLALFQSDARFRSSPDMAPRLPWIYRLAITTGDDDRLAALFNVPHRADSARP